jgi:hypothetical protein
MPAKRSRKNKKQVFNCPFCQDKLWRVGSPKHYLYYREVAELQENLNISRKKASLLIAQNNTYLDKNTWIESFFCQEHGTMWLKLSHKVEQPIKISLANDDDWQRSSGTINPNFPNPSVSEYSYYMSRKPQIKTNTYSNPC